MTDRNDRPPEGQGAIGVIGGSGLYEMEGLEDVASVSVDTPFGSPSDALITGTLEGCPWFFSPDTGEATGSRLLT